MEKQYFLNNEFLSIPQEDALWIIGFIGLGIYLLIHVIGKIRYGLLAEKYEDQFKDSVSKLQANTQRIMSLDWFTFLSEKPQVLIDIQKLQNSIQSKLNTLTKVRPFSVLETIGLCLLSRERIQEVALFNTEEYILTNHIKSLAETHQKLNLADRTVKHNHYQKTNSQYRLLCDLTNNWTMALNLYQQVRREIDEAQSAISSAESMEVVDLFTKSKLVSVASSMSNSSAQGEIDDIKPALNRLKSHLEKLQLQEQATVQEIKISGVETLDLIGDLFFDFSFDFGSVFSLFSLGSTSSSLDKLESNLRPLRNQLDKAVSEHQNVQDTFLNKLP